MQILEFELDVVTEGNSWVVSYMGEHTVNVFYLQEKY